MKKPNHKLKKVFIIILIIGTLGGNLFFSPTKAYADNNLTHTNGAEAAIVASIAAVGANVLHNLIRSTWNSYFKTGEPVWRSNRNDEDRRQRLLRYDTRDPDIIFREGFTLRNNLQSVYNFRWSLGEYLSGRYRDRDNPFVSTTRPIVDQDGEVIYKWVPKKFYRKDRMFLYEIFAPGGIDAEASLGTLNPYPEQDEVTFPGGIRREFIRSVQELDFSDRSSDTPRLVRTIINPYFVGIDGLPEIEIPTGTKVEQWQEEKPKAQLEKAQSNENTENEYDPIMQPGSMEPNPFKNDPKNPRRLGDGEYQIRSSIDPNKTLDLSKYAQEAPVYLYQNYSLVNQRWKFEYSQAKKAYRIRSSKYPKYVLTTSAYRKNKMTVYDDNVVGDDSYWQLEENKDGTFTVRNYKDKNLVLDLNDSKTENRAPVSVYPSNGGKNQKWKIDLPSMQPLADGEYKIQSHISQKAVVDLSGPQLGVAVYIYQDCGLSSQRWRLKYDASKRAYQIASSQNPQRLLTMINGSPYKVIGWSEGSSKQDNSYWQLEQNPNGSFTVKSYANANLVLDLAHGNTADRTVVQGYPDNGGGNQKWHFEKINNVRPVPDGEYQISFYSDKNQVLGRNPAQSVWDFALVEASQNLNLDTQKWNVSYSSQYDGYHMNLSDAPALMMMQPFPGFNGEIRVFPSFNKLSPFWELEETNDGYYFFRRKEEKDLVMEEGPRDEKGKKTLISKKMGGKVHKNSVCIAQINLS